MKVLFLLLLFPLSLFADPLDCFYKAQEELKKAPYWIYPSSEAVNQLRADGRQSILMFNYGSLMDESSAARTLSPASMATRRLGVAFGLRRLFDRDAKIYPNSIWGLPKDPNARGMLNVILSKQPEDFVNGILVDVILDDIPNLILREEGYDLIPVIVQDWKCTVDIKQPNYLIAYAFHAPQNKEFTNSTILPRSGYYELTCNAALTHGKLFYQIWLKTTFLADGVTPITEWQQVIPIRKNNFMK